MIPSATIKYIFNALASALSLNIIRADQAGDAPVYPYGTYKNLSVRPEAAHQNIKSSSGVNRTVFEFTDEVFSLSFIDKGRIDRVRDYADSALRWFKSVNGHDVLSASGVTAQLVGNQIQDRTTLIDSFYENKVGFDLRLLYMDSYEEAVGKIETVELTPTYDGVEGDPYEIPEE